MIRKRIHLMTLPIHLYFLKKYLTWNSKLPKNSEVVTILLSQSIELHFALGEM